MRFVGLTRSLQRQPRVSIATVSLLNATRPFRGLALPCCLPLWERAWLAFSAFCLTKSACREIFGFQFEQSKATYEGLKLLLSS
jgi:hypothetical protein